MLAVILRPPEERVLIASVDVDSQGAYTLAGSWQDGDSKLADDDANALGDQAPG